MSRLLVLHAHPFPSRSVATRSLLDVFTERDDVAVRSLYELYPDFDVDVQAERQAVQAAQALVWLAPVYWYSIPALLKHWIDAVLGAGWAYGENGSALAGKSVWWVASAGAEATAYAEQGSHLRPFEAFTAPLECTARYCGMRWLPPFVVYAGAQADEVARDATKVALARACSVHFDGSAP